MQFARARVCVCLTKLHRSITTKWLITHCLSRACICTHTRTHVRTHTRTHNGTIARISHVLNSLPRDIRYGYCSSLPSFKTTPPPLFVFVFCFCFVLFHSIPIPTNSSNHFHLVDVYYSMCVCVCMCVICVCMADQCKSVCIGLHYIYTFSFSPPLSLSPCASINVYV